MSVLDVIAATYILAALYLGRRQRALFAMALAGTIVTPIWLAASGGIDGLFFAISGCALAIVSTLPLSLFGIISRTDVLLSVAVGEMLGAYQYALVLAIAAGLLLVQWAMKIAFRCSDNNIARDVDSALITLDEQSALVEIEAMKILHADRREFEELARIEGYPGLDARSIAPAFAFTWVAKIAIATIAVLMFGVSG